MTTPQEIKTLLGTGLSGGYGASNYGKTTRAGFDLDTSDYQNPLGKYHDEWAAHQNGGGQELVQTSTGQKATRVYAGGTLAEDKLIAIGTTSHDVSEKLKYFLGTLGAQTRLDTQIEQTTNDWKYSYTIISQKEEIPVIVGEETITYKDTLVFVHYLINSPVV